MKIRFFCKVNSFILYTPRPDRRRIEFQRGIYETSDPVEINGIRNCADYRVTITEKVVEVPNPPAPVPPVAPAPQIPAAPQVEPAVNAPSAPANAPAPSGTKVYQCKHCDFSTTDLNQFRGHALKAHKGK